MRTRTIIALTVLAAVLDPTLSEGDSLRPSRSPHHRKKFREPFAQQQYGGYQQPPINIAISQSQSSAAGGGYGHGSGYYPTYNQFNDHGYGHSGYPQGGFGNYGNYNGGYHGPYDRPHGGFISRLFGFRGHDSYADQQFD